MEIYDRKRILEYWKTRLTSINNKNRKDALSFIDRLEHEGISALRIARYARMLMILDKIGNYRNVGKEGKERKERYRTVP